MRIRQVTETTDSDDVLQCEYVVRGEGRVCEFGSFVVARELDQESGRFTSFHFIQGDTGKFYVSSFFPLTENAASTGCFLMRAYKPLQRSRIHEMCPFRDDMSTSQHVRSADKQLCVLGLVSTQ